MSSERFYCPQCRLRLQESEVERREVDTMFGEGRWWYCRTCGAAIVTYPSLVQTPSIHLDVYDLIAALGRRALDSVWLGSGVDCLGINAEPVCALLDRGQAVPGHELFRLMAGVEQTIEGDFKAYDTGVIPHWLYVRAWDGGGFYVETSDPSVRGVLQSSFPLVEEVGQAAPLYEGLFIRASLR